LAISRPVAICRRSDAVVFPAALYKALEVRHLAALAAQLRALQAEERGKWKHERIAAMREAGYGATSDHVTFARNVFASQHEVFTSR
jgi:hypothetical protein